MERSFILRERPGSRSQRPMEMGCAYNEAQVRVTLFKKWGRHAPSQLGWTQVLQTLLSAPFDDPPYPLAFPFRRFVFFRVKHKIKLWHGGSWTKVCCHLPTLGPSSGVLNNFKKSELPSPLLAWPSPRLCCPVNRFK